MTDERTNRDFKFLFYVVSVLFSVVGCLAMLLVSVNSEHILENRKLAEDAKRYAEDTRTGCYQELNLVKATASGTFASLEALRARFEASDSAVRDRLNRLERYHEPPRQ